MKIQEVESLSVMLVQTDIYWENVEANLASLEEIMTLQETPVDLIILPEMFNTGFSMNKDIAEPMNLTTTRWMKQMAKRFNAMLMGSIAIKEAGNVYNRMLCVYPDGRVESSDKRHLFRMGAENKVFTAGESRQIITWRGWRISPLICYDLRFPVWSRNTANDPYDLLIYVASWPARRAYAWNTLLKARAIENQSYVIGVNRVGLDAQGVTYEGDSVVLNYLGEPLMELLNEPSVVTTKLIKNDLVGFRESFPSHLDADEFSLLTQ